MGSGLYPLRGEMSAPARPRSLVSLILVSLRLGAAAFGGLGATLALLQRELVERRGWLQARDIKDALAFTKPLPGSTVVQVVAFLGWRLAGWPGAVVAAVAFLSPATVLMTIAAAATLALPDTPSTRGALAGVQAAAVGLLAAAFWRLVRDEAGSRQSLAVVTAAFVAGLFVNAALVVALAAAAGVVLNRARPGV